MDFALNDDQNLLKETASRLFGRDLKAAPDAERDGAKRAADWATMADLGLIGGLLPESAGGFGGSIETMVILEAAGASFLTAPLVTFGVIGGTLLAAADGPARAERLEALVGGTLRPCLATMEAGSRSPYDFEAIATAAQAAGDGYLLTGRKGLLADAGDADSFLVTARIDGVLALFLVPRDAAGVELRASRTIDGRTAGELLLDGVALDAAARIDVADVAAALEFALDRGAAAACAEAVGSMAHLLEATIAYTRQREQYGAPLASNQALQHRMADMFVEIEMARSMAYLAASAVDGDGPGRVAAVSGALVQVGRSARFVGQEAVQLHGGMGMSEELDVAHHFKRLSLIPHLWGDSSFHLRRFAAADTKPE